MTTEDAETSSATRTAYSDPMIIQVLEGLEPVRLRPGMYIGDVHDGSGLHNLVNSLIKIAVEEHAAGLFGYLSVRIHRSGALTVEHDGACPCWVPPSGIAAAIERHLTVLHSHSDYFHYALPVANGLSEWLVFEVRREGRRYQQRFRQGAPEAPVSCVVGGAENGWRVDCQPDPAIFASVEVDAKRVLEQLRPLAFLNPGLRVEFIDERPGGIRETFHGEDLSRWVERLTEGRASFPPLPLRLRGTAEDVTVDMALRWTGFEESRFFVYVNHSPVSVRVDLPLLRGVAKALSMALRANGQEHSLRAGDLRRGLVAVAHIQGPDLPVYRHRPWYAEKRGPAFRKALRATVARAMNRELERDRTLLPHLVDWLALPTSA